MFFSGSRIWGHRGWPTRFPDNTEAGIRAAAQVAAGVEIDIRPSADGRLVLSHDPQFAGVTIADRSWESIAGLEVEGHPPVLLDQVLDLAVPLDLEVKNDPAEPGFDESHDLARRVADRARNGDVVTSFWWPSVDAVRLSHPHVVTGLLCCDPVTAQAAIRHAVDRGHAWVAPEHPQIDEAAVDLARREGIALMAWTVDDAVEAIRLADLGVDAIITNRPGELVAADPKAET